MEESRCLFIAQVREKITTICLKDDIRCHGPAPDGRSNWSILDRRPTCLECWEGRCPVMENQNGIAMNDKSKTVVCFHFLSHFVHT